MWVLATGKKIFLTLFSNSKIMKKNGFLKSHINYIFFKISGKHENLKKNLNNVYTIIPVIASLECYNKIPHIWWIKERKIVGSQFWRSFRHLVRTVTLSCLIFVTPRTSARQASLSITSSESLPKLISIKSVMTSNHLIICRLLLLPPSIFPSIRVFSNESVLPIRWSNYWSFSFSISPSNESSGLISFRMDWFDLLAVQGTLESLFQHHRTKASIHLGSAFFMVQLSHPYMTYGKTIALTRWIFVGK